MTTLVPLCLAVGMWHLLPAPDDPRCNTSRAGLCSWPDRDGFYFLSIVVGVPLCIMALIGGTCVILAVRLRQAYFSKTAQPLRQPGEPLQRRQAGEQRLAGGSGE